MTQSTTSPAISEFVTFAHQLADASAAAILPHFRIGLAVENKAGEKNFDPVTLADRNAELAIREALAEHFPEHGIVGEEFGNKPAADGAPRWIIDPIDGTRSFISGMPTWGTLIGLYDGARPLIGMMNQPFTGERFWSDGAAALYRGPDGERRLATRTCAKIAEAVLYTTHPDLFSQGRERDGFEGLRKLVRMTRFGGDCYAYCLLAAGQIDIVIEAGLQSYDVAALIPIVETAGGRMTNWDGGPCHDGGQVIACGDPVLHAALLEQL